MPKLDKRPKRKRMLKPDEVIQKPSRRPKLDQALKSDQIPIPNKLRKLNEALDPDLAQCRDLAGTRKPSTTLKRDVALKQDRRDPLRTRRIHPRKRDAMPKGETLPERVLWTRIAALRRTPKGMIGNTTRKRTARVTTMPKAPKSQKLAYYSGYLGPCPGLAAYDHRKTGKKEPPITVKLLPAVRARLTEENLWRQRGVRNGQEVSLQGNRKPTMANFIPALKTIVRKSRKKS